VRMAVLDLLARQIPGEGAASDTGGAR